MNLLSFSAKRNFYLPLGLLLLFLVPSCARKNSHVYDFVRNPPPCRRQRITLPYVQRLQGFYDPTHQRYVLTWSPISLEELPEGIHFLGYNFYRATGLGFLPKRPCLQIPAGMHSTEMKATAAVELFGIAPLFVDALNREITGLITVKKISKLSP